MLKSSLKTGFYFFLDVIAYIDGVWLKNQQAKILQVIIPSIFSPFYYLTMCVIHSIIRMESRNRHASGPAHYRFLLHKFGDALFTMQYHIHGPTFLSGKMQILPAQMRGTRKEILAACHYKNTLRS